MMRSLSAMGITALALLVAGCDASGDQSPTATPDPTAVETTTATATATTSAEASPSPSPTLDPHPPVEELVATPDGLGPLAIGEPPEGNPGEQMISFDEDYCAGGPGGAEGADPGRWVAEYDDVTGFYDSTTAPFTLAVDDDEGVWRIDIFATEIASEAGISIGSTLAELEDAHPDLESGSSGGVSDVWWIEGDEGYLVFETQGEESGLQPEGTPPTVILMRVLDDESDPDFATANSDDVAGGCL
ncbi:hypothetical protein ACNI3K_01475 [Demequina sp. SO4-13]|uniref:hypothetical protein n=1 Tax=Demequina sp. SO4-13 TaxID=3401027 RepID=UPI003AF65AFB